MPLAPSKLSRMAQPAPMASAKRMLPILRLVSPEFSPTGNRTDAAVSAPVLDLSQSSSAALEDLSGSFIGNSLSPLAPPPEAEKLRTYHLGGEVKNSYPLRRFIVMYPQLAKAARIFGKVVIHAIISETGNVIDARAVSGPPLLYGAAVDAVSKERFAPMLLNGQPTKCDLMVQVSFTLNGAGD